MNKNATETTIDTLIWDTYAQMKEEVILLAKQGDAETCMCKVFDLWMFMNRFRNCDLQKYFDEDLHKAIQSLNPRTYDTSPRLHKKSRYRIAFIIGDLIDTGGASIPHRFMLDEYETDEVQFDQYILVSNLSQRDTYKETESYRYVKDHIKLKEFEHLPSGMGWLEKGQRIEQWLYDNEIDFVYATPCPSTLYALASRPALIQAMMSQDCYTFAVGPGASDFTFLVTTDQVLKYRLAGDAPEKRMKVVLLPLHTGDYIEDTEPMDLSDYGIASNAVVSASTNMWKTCFGDGEILLEGIAELLRRHPNYHHVFAGTPRCLDNVEAFLSKNPDIKDRIHFVGIIKNIYKLLKSTDFWINSFPTTGGSDIECALVGKPTIEIVANRNLDLHPVEFLQASECNVISMDEFVTLGERFITDPEYRDNLGQFLKQKINREFDKKRLVKERIYDFFVHEYAKRLEHLPTMPALGLDETIAYEKRIALYNSYGHQNWDQNRKRKFLDECRNEFPSRPFAWIKALEEAIESGDNRRFEAICADISEPLSSDHRINVMIAIGYDAMNLIDKALLHAQKALSLAKYDPVPARVTARIFARGQSSKETLKACRKIPGLETLMEDEMMEALSSLPSDEFPIYYNY